MMSGPTHTSPRIAPASRRPTPRRARRAASGRLVKAAANAVFPLLALAILGVLATAASCAPSATSVPGGGSSSSDVTVTTAAPASGDEWIPLPSHAPADILAAARSGQLFQESQASGGEGAPDLSRLGTPTFVQALRPTGVTADQLPDFYVVPVLNAGGDATDAVELALNPARSAVQEIAIVTYATAHADGAISALTQSQAVQMVVSQRHVAASALGQPSLVYFALDPQWQGSQSDQSGWAGGGALPADPIWLVPADGGPYVAGNDGAVYSVSQLPQGAP